jgi:ABC-type transport system substrate-binding protein/class 3 adenylate cyclase
VARSRPQRAAPAATAGPGLWKGLGTGAVAAYNFLVSVTAGQRRVVSALVADVAGSTAIGEQLGPERSKFLFDEVARLMREEVERFGGTVAQLTGDGILALFGAPTGHEDDSERAVRAALALHESLARYAAEVAPAYGIELAVRVAVNTGPVVLPRRDAPPDVLYNALGDTVNVAARLQAFGDLVVGPATARQVEESFELEELGELELKGKTAPVSAFRVVGVRERPPARLEPTLVGRKRELAALSEALDGLVEGKGSIVSITGEPGIGKSRLVAEAEERFDGRVRFLGGHAVSYAETIPYWPVRELLRGWLGLGGSDSEARVRLELRAELARTLADEEEEAYPFLATLLGLALEPEQEQRMRDFAGDAVQHQTFDWLYQLVCALARERPLCLVLEDLHWSDEATLSMLDELLPAAEQTAVAFLLVHRSDPDHPAWQLVDRARRRFRRLFIELQLEPLEDADARVLAEADARGELPEELAQILAERAGGNPYFVGEAIRDLRERGALERENGHVVLVGEASVPAAVQEALQARLDRLDSEARELVTIAAVIGRSFSVPLLERLLPQARLLPTLSELQWLQLVVEERSGAAPEYRFRHGLVQEVAYGTLVEARRRDLHLRVGEALAELHRDSPAEVYGLLARHFAEAEDAERAADYNLKAGDTARSSYASEEALAHYERALAFLDQLGDADRARQTLLRVALTHHLAFDYRAANEAFGQAFARPAPASPRLEPSERITWAVPSAWDREVTPGHSYTEPAFEVTRNLFRGLVAIGRDFDVEPDLAERFTVSDDGRSYRFTLRPDARWSDGAPATADDFAFTYAQMVEDGVATASWLDGVSASSIDERTLEIRLRDPRNDFLYVLTQPPFFPWPRHVYELEGRDWRRANPLVGSGPFVLTGRDEDHVVIEASPTWHGSRGNVSEVTLELEASPAVAADRWRRGEYDVLHFVLTYQAVADDQTLVQRSGGRLTWFLGFNARRAPLDDARVRRAVAHAIDRHGPAERLRGTAAATGGLIPPTMPGHSYRVAPAFDPDRARALLIEAGYADGRALGEIELACLELWEDATADVAAQLEEIGVRVRLLPVASDPELEAAIEDGAHAWVWAWGGEYPDTGRGFLDLIFGEYPSLYRDEELEEVLARDASLRDQDERLRTYRDFERIWIGEQAAVVPIAYGDLLLWRRPWVSEMWVNATEISTFAQAVVRRPHPSRRRR